MKYVFLRMITLVSIIIILGSIPSYAEEVRGVTDDTIKVGVVLDMSGPVANLLLPCWEAYKNYFRYINEQGGIHGRNVKMILEDDRYTIPASVAAYKKLVFKDKVLAILFMGGSGQHKALYDRIEKDKVPVVTGAWSYHVSRPFKRYSFQPTNDNVDEIKMIVDYIVNNVKKEELRLAYVYADNEAGKSGLEQLEKSIKLYGLKLLAKEVVGFGDVDASSQVMNLKKDKINYIVSMTAGRGTFALLKDARKFGYSPAVMSSFHLMGEDTVRIAGKAAENQYGVSTCASWYDDAPGVARMKEVTLRYHPVSKEPKYAEDFGSNRYYTKGWLGALIFAEGAKRAGKDLNHETLVTGLEKIRDFDTGGLTAPISYGPDRRKANDSGKFYKADVGKERFVAISGWVRPAH
ncbi:MAG: amino acid/amide ABC transporter substrate-binding protein HAAT family [bacterium]|nr:MAG: amino acid/amide ABC transporter substrate-binding protein HAAT family [bacterium]